MTSNFMHGEVICRNFEIVPWKYYLIGLFFLWIVNDTFAQSDTSEADKEMIQRLLSIQSKSPEAGVKFTLGGASSDIHILRAFPIVTKRHLSEEDKERIFSDISGRFRIGYWQETEIFYRQPGYYSLDAYKSGSGFAIRNQSYTSVGAPREVAALALFGNRRFENQTLDIGNSSYESWWFTSLGYSYESVYDSIPYTVEASLVVNHGYRKYSAKKASIYTAPYGEFIDADLDYHLVDAGNSSGVGINGLGFSAGFHTTLPLSGDFSLDLHANDVGVVFLTNTRISRVDSSFRFRGGNFENIFEINDSLFRSERNRISNGLYNRENSAYTALLPFKVRAQVNRKLQHHFFKKVWFFSEYRHLSGYVPRTGFGSMQEWKQQQLLTELYYGGFNSFGLKARYATRIFNYYNIAVGSDNVLALLLPFTATGTSVYVAVSYTF